MAKSKILILGIGNILLSDEGIGVHVAQLLEKKIFPENISVIDGGTGGFHLLSYFEDYTQLILIDATIDNAPIGTVKILTPKYATDYPQTLSAHDIGLKDLVESAYLLDKSPEVHLITVSIGSVQIYTLACRRRLKKRFLWCAPKLIKFC